MKSKVGSTTRQISLTIRVKTDRYCDPKCVGFFKGGINIGLYDKCSIFQTELCTANVKPSSPHYDDLVRCRKCRKAEVKPCLS